MAKTATQTTTKAATKRASAKTDKEDKPKRAPTAYNIFVKENMKTWREANPDKPHKEAMAAIGALWRDAPENPNRGNDPKARKPKADKENAKSKPKKGSNKKQDPMSDEEEEVVASSDA